MNTIASQPKRFKKCVIYTDPLIIAALRELQKLMQPTIVLDNNTIIHYSHYEYYTCILHGYPNVHIKVYHKNANGTDHGYRKISICLECLQSI